MSNPFEAGRLSIAFASSASNLAKTGSPNPTGTLVIRQHIIPPRLSPSFRAFSIASTIAEAASGSGQRVGEDSTSSNLILAFSYEPLIWCI